MKQLRRVGELRVWKAEGWNWSGWRCKSEKHCEELIQSYLPHPEAKREKGTDSGIDG